MDNKLSELKDALEFLETTEFDGEWDSALVGGENGKNYHAVINANDVVVRAADDSRHTSWLCDYLEAVSPLNIRALLAELEAKDERIGELEVIATEYAGKFQKAQDANKHLIIMSNDDKKRIAELEKRLELVREQRDSELRTSAILEKRLATPVRLPNKNDAEFWFDGVFQVAKFDRAVERAVSEAGFKFVGDE